MSDEPRGDAADAADPAAEARKGEGGGAGAPAVINHEVNFFKPTSAHAKANMKLIITLVIVWAVAVFGFQFLLLALQRDTPEPIYSDFQAVWSKVAEGSATADEQRTFARATLAVLGKNIAVSAGEKAVLKDALSATVRELLPAGRAAAYNAGLGERASAEAVAIAAGAIGLAETGFDKLMRELLPTSLVAGPGGIDDERIPVIMTTYLVHNRSGLTDFTFLGFPFHYWYTAQFLLILFVVLCLIYAVVIEKIHAKHGFVEE